MAPAISRRAYAAAGICILAGAIRSVHLLSDNFFVSSQDSYYFYYYAHCIQDGVHPFIDIPSGLAYPVGLLAKVTGLNAAAALVPVLLGMLVAALVYFIISRIYGPKVGLFAAGMWALMPQAFWITGAGYLDRDGLVVGVVMAQVLGSMWVISRGTRWLWGIPALAALAAMAMALLWSWVGVVIAGAAGILMATAASRAPWRPVVMMWALVAAGSGGALLYLGSRALDLFSIANHDKYQIPISESHSMTPIDAFLYWHPILLCFVALGLVVAVRRRHSMPGDLGAVLLLAGFIIAGILVKRVAVFLLPSMCVLGGIGAALAADKISIVYHEVRSRIFVVFIAVILLIFVGSLFWHAYLQGTIDRLNPSPQWQEALAYIKEETPEDAKILSSGDYGYWILALGERVPLAYGGPLKNREAVAAAYCNGSPGATMAAMRSAGADYFVFDIEDYTGPVVKGLSNINRSIFCQDPGEIAGPMRIIRGDTSSLVFFNGRVAIIALGG